jgi:hypothetical protein
LSAYQIFDIAALAGLNADMSGREKNDNRYPAEWEAISAAVLELANHTCQGSPSYPECRTRNGTVHPVTGSRVILTVAHLDQNPTNCRWSNLRALCQRCHLTYDAKWRASTFSSRTG